MSIEPFRPTRAQVDHHRLLVPLEEWAKTHLDTIYSAETDEQLGGALSSFFTNGEEYGIIVDGSILDIGAFRENIAKVSSFTIEDVDATPDDADEPKWVSATTRFSPFHSDVEMSWRKPGWKSGYCL